MKRVLKQLYIILLLLFLYAPIIFLALFSFNSGDTMVSFDGFSLQWYNQLFHDQTALIVIINTLIIGFASALFASIIGVCGAFVIHNMRNENHKDLLYSLNSILLVSPDVIIGISLLLLFTILSISLGFWTVLISHIVFSIPIVVIMVLPRLSQLNNNIIDAAKDLGATDKQVMQKIIMPLIFPSVLAGFFTALTYSLDDFAVTFFVTGNGFSTLSIQIYSSARTGISLEINALSTIIFALTLAVAFIYYFIDKKRVKGGLK